MLFLRKPVPISIVLNLSRRLFSNEALSKSVEELDRNLFRTKKGSDLEIIRASQQRRFADVSLVDQFIVADKNWRTKLFQLEQDNKSINTLHKEIGRLKVAKLDATEVIKKTEDLKKEIAAKEVEVKAVKKELDQRLSLIGNLVHDSVPVDNDEVNSPEVWTWGKCTPKGKLINHADPDNKLQIADLVKGSFVAGEGGYFLDSTGGCLYNALVGFGLSFLHNRTFELLRPPSFMRKEIMARCAQLSQIEEELYKVIGDEGDRGEVEDANELYLISTPEQPLHAYHLDERIYPQSLPMRYAGFSTCFHKKARSHRRDPLQIFGAHQSSSVDLYCITSPNDNKSWEMHEEMLSVAKDFYMELGLPYRVVNVVSGALDHAAAKTYRIEGWFPASETFMELASCSNYTDFQAKYLGSRYGQKKNDERTKQFVHLLNCNLIVLERVLCCILENYQKEDGVVVPEVLRPHLSGTEFLPFEN